MEIAYWQPAGVNLLGSLKRFQESENCLILAPTKPAQSEP